MTVAAGTVAVIVKPGAKAPGFVIRDDGAIVIRVRERAIEGQANEAARKAIAGALGVPKSAVALVRGAASKHKTFAVRGMTAAAIGAGLKRFR